MVFIFLPDLLISSLDYKINYLGGNFQVFLFTLFCDFNIHNIRQGLIASCSIMLNINHTFDKTNFLYFGLWAFFGRLDPFVLLGPRQIKRKYIFIEGVLAYFFIVRDLVRIIFSIVVGFRKLGGFCWDGVKFRRKKGINRDGFSFLKQ